MNTKAKFVLVKNAFANVARGGSAAVIALFLAPILTRWMSPVAYGAWSLVLQISAYVGYLDFGIQTAVGRFLAHANERGDAEQRDRIASTSLIALSAAAMVGIAIGVGVALLLPRLFQQLPIPLVRDTRIALLLVSSSLAVGLPASVFNGIFIGLQRYEVPAVIIGGSRALSAVLLVLVVRHGGSLAAMGAAMAVVNLASYGVQYWMYRRMAPMVRLSAHLVSRHAGRELFDYCLSLSIWSFAMLLVTGLDISMVGYFQFEAVAYYAVAATLTTFLAGLQNAAFGVLIPSTAAQQARGDAKGLGCGMITATRYGGFLLLITGLPLVLSSRAILYLWVGPLYADHGGRLLQVLAAANMIRLSAVPYIMVLVGTGQQRLVTVTPLLEGLSNLLASIVGGYLFGAVGVAGGTLVGALVGVGGNFFYNMPRTEGIAFRISDYLRDGMLRPAVCALPLVIYVGLIEVSNSSDPVVKGLCLAAALLATGFLTWRWGLLGTERERLRSWRLALQA